MSLLKHSHAGAYMRAHAYRHARRRQPKSPNLKHIFTHYVSFGDRSRDRQDRPAACLSPKQNWFIPVFPSFQRGIFGAGRAAKRSRQEWDRLPSLPRKAKHGIALNNRQQTKQAKEKQPNTADPPCGITKQRKPPTGEATLSGGRKNGYYRSAGRSLSLSSPLSLRSASGLTGSVGSAG